MTSAAMKLPIDDGQSQLRKHGNTNISGQNPLQTAIDPSKFKSCSPELIDEPSHRKTDYRNEWKLRRQLAEDAVRYTAYNPLLWISLADCYGELKMYSSLQAFCAYKTIILIGILVLHPQLVAVASPEKRQRLKSCYSDAKSFLEVDPTKTYHLLVQEDLVNGNGNFGLDYLAPCQFHGRIEAAHKHAYMLLINALQHNNAIKDAIVMTKKAMMIWPHDEQLPVLCDELSLGYLELIKGLCVDHLYSTEEKLIKGRTGIIAKADFDWVDVEVKNRSPASLEAINAELNRLTHLCEVKQNFLSDSQSDTGSLGLFCLEDIPAGTNILVDRSNAAISNIKASAHKQCDNCHASLHNSVVSPSAVRVARCCSQISYCSQDCLIQSGTLHTLNCGKSLDFLYKNITSSPDRNTSWDPILMHRLLSVIRVSEVSTSTKQTETSIASSAFHPLTHPLINRLTTSYPDPSAHMNGSNTLTWSLNSHVIAPILSLATLGIDPFTNYEYSGSGETIATIYARVDNNACRFLSTSIRDGYLDNEVFVPGEVKSAASIHRVGSTVTSELQWELMCIFPNFIFLNHACSPNIEWGTAGIYADDAEVNPKTGKGRWVVVGTEGKQHKEWIQLGASAMVLTTMREVKKGEEFTIGYVPKGYEGDLEKWFEGGCWCVECK